ncbi:MAG: SsrA-binding protein SmpB [Alphaproteobacteria bacterium]|nr:SsrA-binding protein SmpB [Alphaproteobacteria bacterium]
MAKNTKKDAKGLISVNHTVAENRRARFDYFLEEKFEAGVMLTGTEVKSLRHGQCSLNECFAEEKGGDLWLIGSYIAPYGPAGAHLQHVPRRERKLLMHRRELARLFAAVKQKGYTIVPVRLYFNARGVAKVEIALAKGKAQHDKRETIKQRDWNRSKNRILRGDGD